MKYWCIGRGKEVPLSPQTKKLQQFSIQFIFFRTGCETIFFFFSAVFEDMWVALIGHEENLNFEKQGEGR
jgi:hypothetical protein